MPDARKSTVVPSHWADFYDDTRIPAALRVGDFLYVTGHTGTLADGSFPVGAEAQIRQTFLNVALTLEEAGAGWSDVVRLDSYHVGLRAQGEALMAVAADFLSDPLPAWTAVGVTELFEPDALVEISCTAIVPPPA
jgi:enamine deaminase RidA (YjgF/YER057c/UK114 family)